MRIAVCLIAALSLHAQGVNFFSIQKEAALGANLAAEARKTATVVDSLAVRAYFDKLAQQLGPKIPGQAYTFSFDLVADETGGETHEPMAFPAGYIFVPTKLLLAAQSESEFVGMLAHAMAHVKARHWTRQATKQELMNLPPSSGAAVPASALVFHRANERQADYLALAAMADAGYDPQALYRYVERTQPDTGGPLSPLLGKADRLAGMQNAIKKLPAAQPTASSQEFLQVREEIGRR